MWFRDVLIAQLRFLEREKERIQSQIRILPKGTLVKKKAKGKNYFYIKKGKQLLSLRKEDKLKNEYLFRDNLKQQLATIDRNIPLLQRAIKSYHPLVELTTMWASIEAQQNGYHAENRIHVYRGVAYRSKSEMLIAMALTSYGIEFKYEAKMEINGRYIYPDFVIKRPKDGKIFIWEHFGRMDLEDYRRKSFHKLEDYHYQGFDLWDNFIASFDQGAGAINMDYIDKIIKLYLL